MTRFPCSHFLLAAAVCLSSSRAWAQFQQVAHTRTVPLTHTNFTTSITVPKFDPALGTLVEVGITAACQIPVTMNVENTDPVNPDLVFLSFAASFALQRPGGSTIFETNPSANLGVNLLPFDGTIDFAGPSGSTNSFPTVDQLEAPTPTSAADLALFTGPAGAPGTITLPVLGSGLTTHSGGGSLVVFASIQGGMSIDITYTYDPSRGIRAYRTNTARAPGRVVENFIVVENTGAAPATDVEVIESVDPRFFQLLSVEPAGVLDTPRLAALGVVIWRIPTLGPGETRLLNYHSRLDPLTPLGTNLPGGPLWAGFGLIQQWIACLDDALAAEPSCACAAACCAPPCEGDPIVCLQCRADCLLGCPSANACLRATRDAVVACFDAATGVLGRHQDDSPAVGPFDPNEKRVGNRPTVRPTEAMVYAIHFENAGTLDAIDVFLRDALDPNLDLSTVQFLAGPQGTVDPATREVRWDLLNVNLPPGGTDSVAFSARPVPNLPTGSQVRNRATIQFEATPPIQTNEVVNTIDSARPNGRVSSLPETSITEFVPLSWTGTDTLNGLPGAAAEPLRFSVYVSENDGPYRPFLLDTQDTDAIFVGHAGSHYAFYCVARDAAGNEELQNPTEEASTTVLPPNVALFCSGDGSASPCPCGNASLAGSNEGCVNSLGTGGKLVTSGNASVAADTLRLLGSRMPNCSALYFQGTARENGGMGTPFGDGLFCAAGSLSRLMTKPNAAGASGYPDPADPSLSVRGSVLPGDVRVYQCYYRNAASFCTSATFNMTNAVAVTWAP